MDFRNGGREQVMKKLIIIDGKDEDESKVKGALGTEYDISSVSYFDINNMALSTVITIANTIDSLDAYAGGHSLRVAVIARDIAVNLGWDDRDCQNVYFVALLHDIGMITIPDSIVHKPGRLNEFEYDIIRQHTSNGEKILRDISVLEHLSEGVLYHHERWDGKGYPEGLKQEEIPAFARVIAIADAFDAMSSDRVYRPRLSPDKIISEFLRCKGTQFDPDIADVFIFMLKDGYTVDPQIEQTKEASERAVKDGGLRNVFVPEDSDVIEDDSEMDALTGLFTRAYLNTRVGKKISEERSGALMLIDITGYDKLISESSSDECDQVLKLFSKKLRTFFREGDVVCRIEDDRFAIYVSGESGKGVIEKKASMTAGMVESDEEFAGYRDRLGVAIGISVCMEDGVTFEELYSAAVKALEEARASGESTYRFK